MKIIFADTETTNNTNYGQIAQLSYIIADGTKFCFKNFFFTVHSMDPFSQAIHGFDMQTLERLSEGRVFRDHINELLVDFNDSILVGHNIAYDERFLKNEFQRLGYTLHLSGKFCTCKYFKNICKLPHQAFYSSYKPPKLAELGNFLRISDENVDHFLRQMYGVQCSAHDARRDIVLTYMCWIKGIVNGYIQDPLFRNLNNQYNYFTKHKRK